MTIRALIQLGIFLLAFQSAAVAQSRQTGEIAGANYIIDVPAKPNGDVMFIARGFRPDFFPLSAVYESDSKFYQTLLETGWVIASTSYRTNDWVVEIGGHDIRNLQSYINEQITPIKRSYLYGETMGAGVAVWLAENYPAEFDGVFAMGAHLFPEPSTDANSEPSIASIFTGKPQLPILFIANLEEIDSSIDYTEIVADTTMKPAIWSIDRTGHVNINSEERLRAMEALVSWSEGQTIQKSLDATILSKPTSIAATTSQSAAGKISRIRPLYGNIYTSYVLEDLQNLKIQLGDDFEFTHGNTTERIRFAKAYSDVPMGAWVAFIDSDGYLQISRNYANAAETISAVKGDPLIISVRSP